MGNVCGKGGIFRDALQIDMAPLYHFTYVSEGNKELEEAAIKCFDKMTEAEWNIVMSKGPSGWRLQLPSPSGKLQKAESETDSRPTRASIADKSSVLKEEAKSKMRNFRESVAMAIAPGAGLPSGTPRSARGCEVDIVQEGCCTVRFDTLNPSVNDEEDGSEENDDNEVPAPATGDGKANDAGEGEAPSAQTKENAPAKPSKKERTIQPKPVVLQSTLPLPPQEGDVLGVLLCRRDGTILFLLNGAPLKSVTCPDIILDETDPSSFTAKDGGGAPAPARPDIYVTLGLIGRGECEVNFGGKTYTAHGYIRDIGGGIIKSNAPIQARVFGQRLASFSQMLAELQIFYQIYCPVMLPKAKGMVVMNISRLDEFEEELKANYGKSLRDVRGIVEDVLKRKLYNFMRLYDPARLPEVDSILRDTKGDVDRLNELLRKKYRADLSNVSLRRKQSLEKMLRDYYQLHKAPLDAVKIDQLAEQALTKPKITDKYLREKYGHGINILLQKRLEHIYEAYAPENKTEIGHLVRKYPLFDDEFHLSCKLKVKYNLDLYSFSPVEEGSEELAALRRSLRPSKMPKQLNLLEGEEIPADTGDGEDGADRETAAPRRKCRAEGAARKSVKRASRATAGMAAATAAAMAAAQAAENAAAAAAQAAQNVKDQDAKKEKLREEREKRRRERADRRQSRLDKEALRDMLEFQLKQQAEEEARARERAKNRPSQSATFEEEQRKAEEKRIELEQKKANVEKALGVSDDVWWEEMKRREQESEEEWERLENAEKEAAAAAEQNRVAREETANETQEPADQAAEKRPDKGRRTKSVRLCGDDELTVDDLPKKEEPPHPPSESQEGNSQAASESGDPEPQPQQQADLPESSEVEADGEQVKSPLPGDDGQPHDHCNEERFELLAGVPQPQDDIEASAEVVGTETECAQNSHGETDETLPTSGEADFGSGFFSEAAESSGGDSAGGQEPLQADIFGDREEAAVEEERCNAQTETAQEPPHAEQTGENAVFQTAKDLVEDVVRRGSQISLSLSQGQVQLLDALAAQEPVTASVPPVDELVD